MCSYCFEELIYGFESHFVFKAFEEILEQKQRNEILISIDIAQPPEIATCSADKFYQCTICKEYWILSVPENAWRGYFLTVDEAFEYNGIRHSNKSKNSWKGWAALVILIILITWLIIR